MTLRLVIAAFAFVSIAFSQTLPGYQWIKELDASGMDSVAGLGTDAQGNIYIAGSTSSQNFPVKNAVQPASASAGLYRIGGGTRTALGISSCSALAVDPRNPSTIFAISNGVLMESVNGGVAFAPTTLPSSKANTIAIQPGNDQVLFAATFDQGVFKSADGGATWTPVNNGLPVGSNAQISAQNLWIDPANINVIFTNTANGLSRSADGAASWQPTMLTVSVRTVDFDKRNPGGLYISTYQYGLLKSTDFGQTFAPVIVPAGLGEVIPDPLQSGRLIGIGADIFQSLDNGVTWTQESATALYFFAADTVNGVYYGGVEGLGIVVISASLQTVTPLGALSPPAYLTALSAVSGQVYAANTGSADVFVARLDPSGNILYSTYIGGSSDDEAKAMTVDAQGNVFVAGYTASADFPVSSGAYSSSGNAFLFRLNPDGSLGYSTYFTGTSPAAVATDGNGSAWLLGSSNGGFPVTSGALATTFCCLPLGGGISIGPPLTTQESTLTRFSPSGSSLTFSTYVPGSATTSGLGFDLSAGALAVAPDGTAYVGGQTGFFRIDPTGSKLLSSLIPAPVNPQAMVLGSDDTLYAAGTPQSLNFNATPGAFQTTVPPFPSLPDSAVPTSEAGIVHLDPTLNSVLAASYFGSYAQVNAMTMDAAGNVYIGGSTAPTGLPTRTPFAGGFAYPTGFMSELSGDLSTLLFSSYFGDTENFTVTGLGVGLNGSVVIGGATNANSVPGMGDVYLNGLSLTPPPALRIDSVENAASLIDYPLAAGETIVVNGAGFGSDAQLTIGGAAVSPLSISPTTITAVVPAGVPAAAAAVQVESGGTNTNQVLMPVAVTAPGIFSQSGSGYGRGYILNKDGTLNTPSDPAAPGDKITVFATGVGPLSFTQCCAVSEYPVNVFIDGIYCDGVAAIAGEVNGLPGTVYQITVYVPNPAVLFANSSHFLFPPLNAVTIQVNGVNSQPGLAISLAR